jgi:hypothetical protein
VTLYFSTIIFILIENSVYPADRVAGFGVCSRTASSMERVLDASVPSVRSATGGEMALFDPRDEGFFTVETPNFWERPEMSGLLRDVRTRPDKYAWVKRKDEKHLAASPGTVLH